MVNGPEWGWGTQRFGRRPDPQSLYWERIIPARSTYGDFRAECLKTAAILHEERGRDLVIMFSGGLESEVVLRSFLEIGVKPKVLTMHFWFNSLEFERAQKFCDAHGLELECKYFDTAKFWREGLNDVALLSGCISPSLCALMAAVLEVDGYPVFGYGELDFLRLDRRFFEIRGERWGMGRWLIENAKDGCPAFFRHRPELEAAFLHDPLVQDFQNGSGGTRHRWFLDFKYFFYYHHFGTRWQPKVLFHQLNEEWSKEEAAYREKLNALLPAHDGHFLIEMKTLERLNRGELEFRPEQVVDLQSVPFTRLTERYLRRLSGGSRHGVYQAEKP